MRSGPSPIRSRTRGHRTATGPMPVMISRLGRCPCRTSRWWPSSVSLSAWSLSKAATSASTACASSARAPLRKTSVSGSAKVPGWESWKTLVSVTAYHSFGGEVEASNTPTIRRLTPSCRHQLLRLARELEGHGKRRLVREASLRPCRSMADGCEGALDRVGRAQVLPVLGGKIVEGEQHVAILGQTFDRLVVLRAVVFRESIEGGLDGLPGLGHHNVLERSLGFAL